jgi:uncharacterized membrane protein
MRKWLSLAALAAFLVVGCNKSPEGGTPGTSSSFTIVGPTMTTTIKQDNKETVKLSLDRKSDFKKDVRLTATAPEKVKAELSKDEIKASEPADFTLTITVAKDAALGDHVVKVTGTPQGGGSATSVDVKIKVDKNP